MHLHGARPAAREPRRRDACVGSDGSAWTSDLLAARATERGSRAASLRAAPPPARLEATLCRQCDGW